jgi:hypothetical protein
MATVTNTSKVLSFEGKVKVLGGTENLKNKADVRREIGLVNSAIQIIWRNRNKIICMKRRDQEKSVFESLNKVTAMRRCLSSLSNVKVTTYQSAVFFSCSLWLFLNFDCKLMYF